MPLCTFWLHGDNAFVRKPRSRYSNTLLLGRNLGGHFSSFSVTIGTGCSWGVIIGTLLLRRNYGNTLHFQRNYEGGLLLGRSYQGILLRRLEPSPPLGPCIILVGCTVRSLSAKYRPPPVFTCSWFAHVDFDQATKYVSSSFRVGSKNCKAQTEVGQSEFQNSTS